MSADRPQVESKPLSASLLTLALQMATAYNSDLNARHKTRQRLEEYLGLVDALEAERDRLLRVEKAALLACALYYEDDLPLEALSGALAAPMRELLSLVGHLDKPDLSAFVNAHYSRPTESPQ